MVLNTKTKIEDMSIGDIIPCRYKASSGVAGVFSELGTCTATEIPITGTSTPNGLFYFIKNENGMLVADRVIQTGISWDTLNTARYVQGKLVGAVTIPVGINPNGIWGDSTHVYVANGSSNVTRILRSDNTTTNIAVGTSPFAIWGDTTHVYVANRSSNNVTCILRSDNTTTTIAVGSLPEGIWGDGTHVYVANSGSSNVTRILRSDNTTTTIYVGGNPNAIWGDTTHVYVANRSSNTVLRILRADNTIYSASVGVYPYGIWGDTAHVYISNFNSNNVTCILRSKSTTTTIAVGDRPTGIWGDDTYVYVANLGHSNITRITRADNTTTNIAVGASPIGVWGDETHVYVANNSSNNVTCILRSKDTFIRSLSGGNAYLGTDGKASLTDKGLGAWPPNNEWDKYVVKSDLGGKITQGDNDVWHWQPLYSLIQETGIVAFQDSSSRLARGSGSAGMWVRWGASSASGTGGGFRPVLEYPEDPKCTNIWY
jgi:YVTN family beta-propeller protein